MSEINPHLDIPLEDRPIGVFDSGIGGLSVVLEIQKRIPHQRIFYLADNLNVPYGARTDEDIRQLTIRAVEFLHQKGCKAVIIACNTASAYSLGHLRATYGTGFPVIGLVPAVKPASLLTGSGVIGVLATPGTLKGTLLQDVIDQHATPRQVRVLTAVSPSLVPLVEQGLHDSPACVAELEEVLTPLVEQNIDHLVLGCTHYPFLKTVIRRLFPQLTLVDSGEAVARHTAQTLYHHQLLAPPLADIPAPRPLECFATRYDMHLRETMQNFTGQPVNLRFLLR